MVLWPIDEWTPCKLAIRYACAVNADERDKSSVHPIWKDSVALLTMGIDWANDATEQEKTRKRELMVEVSGRLTEIVGEVGGTYVNEANPYEPKWRETFWGPNYEKLLKVKKRIDPQNMFVCNRCVGSDIFFEP